MDLCDFLVRNMRNRNRNRRRADVTCVSEQSQQWNQVVVYIGRVPEDTEVDTENLSGTGKDLGKGVG